MSYLLKYCKNIFLIVLIKFYIEFGNASNGDPPEIDTNVRTQFKIPIGTKPFKLSCPIKTDTVDDGTIIRWSKDEEEISSTEWSASPYRLLNFNRDLKIRNPRVSDSGHYKCMVINGFGHQKVDFTLQIYDPNVERPEDPNESLLISEKSQPPIWLNRNAIDYAIKTPIKIATGDSLVLKCPATGNPLPKIYWSKNGVYINIELINPTSAKFVINNIKESDSGVYSCRLENTLGLLEANFRVYVMNNVNVIENNKIFNTNSFYDNMPNSGLFGSDSLSVNGILSPPPPQPIIDQPYNSTVRAGHIAQFQCKVQWQKDAPTIRWLRKIDDPVKIKAMTPNATILHINNMHLLVLEQFNETIQIQSNTFNEKKNSNNANKLFVNKLLIQNVQPQDSGRYFCVVSNTAGQFVYRSAYLDVHKTDQFSPLTNTTNIALALIIAFALTLVTIAIIWLCYNSMSNGLSTKNSLILSKPQKFSSTSSTSSSTSSTKYSKTIVENCSTVEPPFNAIKRAIINDPPPLPQIPIPKAPLISPNFNGSTNIGFNHSATMASGLGATLQQKNFQQHQMFNPTQHFTKQQQMFGNNFIHHSQQHLHHDVNSPLLCNLNVHNFQNGNINNNGIGDLLYPSSVTLDRRYTNHQRANFPLSNQQQYQQHILHRTKAEDEMSRLSSHIYDILAATSPLPSQVNLQQIKSPVLTCNNFNENYHSQNYHDHLFSANNWTKNKYAPPPAPPLPPTLPPPPLARPTTPVSLVDEDLEIVQQCQDSDNLIKHLCRSNNQSQNVLQYIEQQQRTVQRNIG